MSITSSTGLISGIDIAGTVEKLMAIERRPVTLLENQIKVLNSERTAFASISAQLLSLKLAVTSFKSGVTFRTNTATSSDEDVLTAKASSTAIAGQYSFTVRQTAQTHQMISQGYNDADQTAIGAGTITLELGAGNLDRDLELNFLRNQQGIRRGTIRITDRSGASADIDLSTAVTVSDILKKINDTVGINVEASAEGDRFVIRDTSGATTQNLVVQDVNGGYTAADLGLANSVAGDTITGNDVVGVGLATQLRGLNDGNGIRTNGYGADLQFTLRDGSTFAADLNAVTLDSSLTVLNNGQGVRAGSIKITNRAGTEATIDLSTAQTLQDVVTSIKSAGLGLDVTLVGGTKLLITDSTGGTKNLKIENVGDGSTASDLGILGEVANAAASLTGKEVFRLATVGDVKRMVEDAARKAGFAGKLAVNVSADGKGISLTDATGGAGDLVVASGEGSRVAEDLGLAGTFSSSVVTGGRVVAGLNTVLLRSLNGGSGVAAGLIEIQDRSGFVRQIDLTGAQTLQDVLDTINSTSGLGVKAQLNANRTGILITDTTGSTAANLKISDVDATTAHDLGLDADVAAAQINSGNNQLQYISENTLLSQLNGGTGVAAGSFTVTDSGGTKTTIALTSADASTKTVGDLLQSINGQMGSRVRASINATGDGILLTDLVGGTQTLTVADVGTGRTASDLNLAKKASAAGASTIDGSFEYKISIGGSDTLQTLADKVNNLKGPFSATIINDGTGVNGYRLSLASKYSGRAGRLTVDGGQTGLNLYDLVEGQDAVIAYGGTTGQNAIIATSNTNTFKNLVPGLTLTAAGTSSKPVTVSVAQDVDSVVEKMSAFVEKFNDVIDNIQELTKYNSETQEAGVLLGDGQIEQVRSRMYRILTTRVNDVGEIHRLGELGFSIGTDAKLTFDEDKFRSAYTQNPEAVEDFFSTKDTGMGYLLDKMADDFTRSSDGTISRITATYDKRTDSLQDRIDYMEDLLAGKEERLYRQFQNMESALAKLQTMQTALASITTSSSSSSSSSS